MVITIVSALIRLRYVPLDKVQVGERMVNYPNFYIQDELTEAKHLGYGSATLFNILRRHSGRPLTRSENGHFRSIISLCLLLSGDIHPCPGPVNIMAPEVPVNRPASQAANTGPDGTPLDIQRAPGGAGRQMAEQHSRQQWSTRGAVSTTSSRTAEEIPGTRRSLRHRGRAARAEQQSGQQRSPGGTGQAASTVSGSQHPPQRSGRHSGAAGVERRSGRQRAPCGIGRSAPTGSTTAESPGPP